MIVRLLLIVSSSLVLLTTQTMLAARNETVSMENKRTATERFPRSSKLSEQNRRIKKFSRKTSNKQSRAVTKKNRTKVKSNGQATKRNNKKKIAAESRKSVKQPSKRPVIAISKGSAISVAKSEVKGKVLSARLINSKGPNVYSVKMLVGDSRVRTVFVDGETGQVIKIN